ncbi:hypothetical protein MAR_032149 [Mya arenaria]|uniref:Myb/SANT-like DNA-binding domain-containing protein n=1 Tax=Mya arenaria TaxID=6604 RepID=A0ABY7F5T2_MYAAR|nr:hypothetical protein MAR_032149 [Mya arenaria]
MEIKYDFIRKYNSSANGKRKVDETWGEVADAVNAVGNGPRTVVQVKERWRNLTKKAKTDYTAEQASLGKTGGGPALPEMSTGSYAIIDLPKDSASFSRITGADLCETAAETYARASASASQKMSATRVTPQNEKAKTLKEFQMANYIEATENQKAQKECFQKLSTLADVLTLKWDVIVSVQCQKMIFTSEFNEFIKST